MSRLLDLFNLNFWSDFSDDNHENVSESIIDLSFSDSIFHQILSNESWWVMSYDRILEQMEPLCTADAMDGWGTHQLLTALYGAL